MSWGIFWGWAFIVLTSFVSLNFIIFSAYLLAPDITRLFYRFILRRNPPQKKDSLDYSLEEFKNSEQRQFKIGFNYVILNLLLISSFIIYPLVHRYMPRFIAMILIAGLIFIIGRAREGIEWEIEREYELKNRDYAKRDFEQRNVMLANTVIKLEQEIKKLKRNKAIIQNEHLKHLLTGKER